MWEKELLNCLCFRDSITKSRQNDENATVSDMKTDQIKLPHHKAI